MSITVSPNTRAQVVELLSSKSPAEAIPELKKLLETEEPAEALAVPNWSGNGASIVASLAALAVGSGDDGSITGTGPRQTWTNQLANQMAQPLQIFRPATLRAPGDTESIEAALLSALRSGSVARAIGSGHSYSDVATTPDFLVDTHGLNQLSTPASNLTGQLTQAMLRSPLRLATSAIEWPTPSPDPSVNRALIEMEAGITIRDLNPQLLARNVALANMGGYDGQTIIGAISTSTHGSGLGLGPFPDMVRSLVLATTGKWRGKTYGGSDPGNGVYYYRIEPSQGITDPAKYSDPLIQLIQDDDCFNATICSMGCFGILYSVVLEVIQNYCLTETRSLMNLAEVFALLAPGADGGFPAALTETRNFEVLIQPYPIDWFSIPKLDPSNMRASDNFFACLVTQRNFAPAPKSPPKPRPSVPDWTARLLNIALHLEPQLTPAAVAVSLLTQIDTDYVNNSYDIYNLGLAGGVGFASEVGFSLVDESGQYTLDHFQKAIDRIHLIAERARLQGNQYQTSPFSLRFVDASRAHLSMMEGRPTAMIELDMMVGTYASKEIQFRYETSMYALGGRPHWGLDFDSMNGSTLREMYPKLEKWLSVYRAFNAKGTFNSRFTERMGFSRNG